MSPKIDDFKPSEHEPTGSFDPLPAGWYAAQVVKSDIKKTRAETGRYIWLEFEVLEQHHPEFKGRKVWVNLNRWNPNEQAVQIANRQFAGLCRAAGYSDQVVNETEMLHNKPVAVKLKIRKDERFGESNDVAAYDAYAARFGGDGQKVSIASSGKSDEAPKTSKPPWEH